MLPVASVILAHYLSLEIPNTPFVTPAALLDGHFYNFTRAGGTTVERPTPHPPPPPHMVASTPPAPLQPPDHQFISCNTLFSGVAVIHSPVQDGFRAALDGRIYDNGSR